MKLFHLCAFAAFLSCVPASPRSSEIAIVYDNKDYTSNVGVVQLNPIPLTTGFSNPIIPLGNTLMLRFDLLEDDFQYLHLMVYHCNADWTPSPLRTLEYLTDFNDFPVNDYDFSQSTYQPYTSYEVKIPTVKLSGNYLLVIKDDDDKPVLSRRFMVFESKVEISPEVTRSTGISERHSHHQLEFDVRYAGINVSDPRLDLKTIILQNHNWQLAIDNLQPTSVRIDRQLLEFRHFSQENTIPGWNEFRFFDTRSLAFRGQGIQSISLAEGGPLARLQPQTSREGLSYSEPFESDLNGNFFLENRDPNEGDIQSEYVNTIFTLMSESLGVSDVYVVGKFNQWGLREENKLQYFSGEGAFRGSVLLKQGFYNYMFFVKKSSSLPYYVLEGCHFQTENEYEILMYFREPGTIFDRLIGYKRFTNR